MPEGSKSNKMEKQVKNYESQKRVSGLLGTTLNDIKNKYKTGNDDLDQMIMSADESYDEYKEKYIASLDVVIPGVTPVGQEILTTASLMNFMEQGRNMMNLTFDAETVSSFKESINDIQTVVAVGPSCVQLKVGDRVKVRMEDFVRVQNPNSVHAKEDMRLPIEELDGKEYLSMHERNIKFVYKK